VAGWTAWSSTCTHPPLGDADIGEWRTLITAAAGNPLVFAKVSGLYPAGPGWAAAAEGDGPENCYAIGVFLIYSSRRYGVECCDVFARRVRPAAVRASRAIQVAC
jgi:hypothetical protein